MRAWIALLFLPLALSAAAADEPEARGCGIFPPDMPFYGGFSGCNLKEQRQPALWRGLPKGAQQVIRLNFTDGHMFFWRSVSITRMKNGAGVLTVIGTSRPTRIRPRMPQRVQRTIKLLPVDLDRIDQLAEAAGVFQFERGSWDDEEIFLHCRTLDMERVNSTGYRVSVVNIGCNQPTKLTPFVNEVVRLAKLKSTEDRMLFY